MSVTMSSTPAPSAGFIDDDLVVNMHHDPVPCRVDVVHGVGEEVAGGGLDEVLGELAAVGFDRTPFAGGAIHPVE